ncbi:Cytokine receptor-like factor 3 [Nymphon striatum]|nr:Cytokine receptor-like factor 3 [Nymphon striatum]
MSNQPVSIPLHSIMFKILEVGEIASPDVEGIGLMQKSNKCWQKEGSVVLNVNGIIAVDGKQMVTQLPELSKGDIIIFTCEYLGPCQRLRVYIESQEKQITFDWKLSSQFLSKPSIENQNMSPFNLALCFFNKGWNISVQ